jgi:hypothetical protein
MYEEDQATPVETNRLADIKQTPESWSRTLTDAMQCNNEMAEDAVKGENRGYLPMQIELRG